MVRLGLFRVRVRFRVSVNPTWVDIPYLATNFGFFELRLFRGHQVKLR